MCLTITVVKGQPDGDISKGHHGLYSFQSSLLVESLSAVTRLSRGQDLIAYIELALNRAQHYCRYIAVTSLCPLAQIKSCPFVESSGAKPSKQLSLMEEDETLVF